MLPKPFSADDRMSSAHTSRASQQNGNHRVSVAALLELTELAKPVEMPCLCCCNTH